MPFFKQKVTKTSTPEKISTQQQRESDDIQNDESESADRIIKQGGSPPNHNTHRHHRETWSTTMNVIRSPIKAEAASGISSNNIEWQTTYDPEASSLTGHRSPFQTEVLNSRTSFSSLPSITESDDLEYEQFPSETCIHSSFCGFLDFKGGLVSSDSGSKSLPSCFSSPKTLPCQSAKKLETDLIITEKPSLSSKGFENTFRILESQLDCNKQKTSAFLQRNKNSHSIDSDNHNHYDGRLLGAAHTMSSIEECVEFECDELQQSSEVDEEEQEENEKDNSSARTLIATTEIAKTTTTSTEAATTSCHEPLTGLDLEFEARERLNGILKDLKPILRSKDIEARRRQRTEQQQQQQDVQQQDEDNLHLKRKYSSSPLAGESTTPMLVDDDDQCDPCGDYQLLTFLQDYVEHNVKMQKYKPQQREEIDLSQGAEIEEENLTSIFLDRSQANSSIADAGSSPSRVNLNESQIDLQSSHCARSNAAKVIAPVNTSPSIADCIPTPEKATTTSPSLIYHASRCADGSKRLRVIRSWPLLQHKVLCGNRVSHMTRAYDDTEAVTRLLEEKEKDLELTVQIGKELLTQNNALENRISELETDLKVANEDRAQLVHELHKKNELIAVLTSDADDGSEAGDTPTFSKSVTFDLLQKKVNSLQDENKSLRMEASQLANETDAIEAKERQLFEDVTSQLSEANAQFDNLSLELERQREENRLQHEQIVSLTARLAEAEMRLYQITADNDEHVSLLNITKENQNSLALELVEFKQRYEEVLALLRETQEQLRMQRKKSMPQARNNSFMAASGMSMSGMSGIGGGFLQPASLHHELMGTSLLSENSLDSGISNESTQRSERIDRLMTQLGSNGVCNAASSALGGEAGLMAGKGKSPYQRVFDTVRCASKTGNFVDSGATSSLSQLGSMSMSSASGPRMSASALPAGSYHRDNSLYDTSGLGNKTLSCESLASQSEEGYPSQASGVPGAPGAKDLEAALKRLTPAEVLARRAMLSYAPAGTYNYDEPPHASTSSANAGFPLGIRTPDSIMSTGSSGVSSTNISAIHQWRLPEKLQIVKPMEGSQTLHHWSRLATPTLSGLLDDRPGVNTRGGRGLDELGMQVYNLEDVEEDVSDELPGKQFESSGCTYTYTTSMVQHPDDGLVNDLSFLSQSQLSSRMASTSTSRQPSCPATPRAGLSRKNSCSTFSVNLGLASMLNERGIKAVTPSALNTPAGPNFSPTVTPCNSPEGSPTRAMSPEPLFGLLTSGADLIRRKLIGGDIERPIRNQHNKHQQQQKILLTRLERRALRSLRLVEKVESIGLENIISSQPSPMSQLASGIADRSSSPMAQLTSLRNLHTSANTNVDDIHFDRDQIKNVLSKGLLTSSSSSSSVMASDGPINSKVPIGHASSSSSAYNSDNDDSICGSESSLLSSLNRTPTNSARGHAEPSKKITSTTEPDAQKALKSKEHQHQQQQQQQLPHSTIAATAAATTSSGVLPTHTESRVRQMQRQKSRRQLKNGMATQRPDLGTIAGANASSNLPRVRNDLGKVDSTASTSKVVEPATSSKTKDEEPQGYAQSFVGSVSSLLFGRKGGWF